MAPHNSVAAKWARRERHIDDSMLPRQTHPHRLHISSISRTVDRSLSSRLNLGGSWRKLRLPIGVRQRGAVMRERMPVANNSWHDDPIELSSLLALGLPDPRRVLGSGITALPPCPSRGDQALPTCAASKSPSSSGSRGPAASRNSSTLHHWQPRRVARSSSVRQVGRTRASPTRARKNGATPTSRVAFHALLPRTLATCPATLTVGRPVSSRRSRRAASISDSPSLIPHRTAPRTFCC